MSYNQNPLEVYLEQLIATNEKLKELKEFKTQMEDYLRPLIFGQTLVPGIMNNSVGKYKVKLQCSTDRKFDIAVLDALKNDPMWQQMPPDFIRWKAEVNVSSFNKLKGEPLQFAQALIIEKYNRPQFIIGDTDVD